MNAEQKEQKEHFETEWMSAISNSTLCNYFYIFFVVFCIWAALYLFLGVWIFASTTMPFKMLLSFIFLTLLSFGLSATTALFLYLICERALKKEDQEPSRIRLQSISEYETM